MKNISEGFRFLIPRMVPIIPSPNGLWRKLHQPYSWNLPAPNHMSKAQFGVESEGK